MSESDTGAEYGDPITARLWAAGRKRRLFLQHCRKCGHHQFYPRNFCLACESAAVEWVEAMGTGVIYSMTVTRVPIFPDMPPPYVVALVQLTEGPRLLSNIVGKPCQIGDAVRVTWRERAGAPPLPIFESRGGAR